jgi:hypothetical protein
VVQTPDGTTQSMSAKSLPSATFSNLQWQAMCEHSGWRLAPPSIVYTHTRQSLVQPIRHHPLLERSVPVVNLRAAETIPQALPLRVYNLF